MKLLKSFVSVLVFGFLCATQSMAEEPLSAAKIKEVIAGNTSIGTTSRGDTYWLYRKADGEQNVKTDSGFSDEGEWWIKEDGKICSKWQKIRKGKASCVKIYPLENNRYWTKRLDGTKTDFKVVPGNPENL